MELREKLREVIDPELDVNIVDLGLVYTAEVENGEAYVEMTLTTPMCPLRSVFRDRVREKALELEEVDSVDVELTFSPRWTPEKMSDEAREKVNYRFE